MRLRAKIDHDFVPANASVSTVVAREALSRPFEVEVTFDCDDATLDTESALYTAGLVWLMPEEGEAGPTRNFHGVVEEAAYEGERAQRHRYRLVLRPYFHGLAYRVRSRIFQDLDAIEIAQKIFKDSGVPTDAVQWSAAGTYPKRVYCTQWKESELAFVSRLLEDEGIFYMFEHSELDHVMKVGDDPSLFSESLTLPFVPWQHTPEEAVTELLFEARRTHDATQLRDWDLQQPNKPVDGVLQGGSLERYEYPGGFIDPNEGVRLARTRLEEAKVRSFEYRGRSTSPLIAPGVKLGVTGAAAAAFQEEMIIVSVEHRYVQTAVGAEAGEGHAERRYDAAFVAIPASAVFRPARITPRPRIAGVESAVVTGPSGEEIHVDELGRIKVHFYWDREGKLDDTASCWIRVMQQNTTGSMILPRIGWEMQVAFLDGDPDRPIAIHKAYNAETMPPYGLPANKTQAALQSVTSPGGGATNEVRMQDGNGGMELFIHASKDLKVVVAHDCDEAITVNAEDKTEGFSKSAVGGNEDVSIDGDQSVSVKGTMAMETAKAKSVTVGATDDWKVKHTLTQKTGGDRTETIGSIMNVLCNKAGEQIDGSATRSVGGAQVYAAGDAIVESVTGTKDELVGAAKIELISKSKAENHSGNKALTSGAMVWKAGGNLTVGAKGAIAITSAGAIKEKIGKGYAVTGKQIRITTGSLKIKGGGTKFDLGGTIKVDASSLGAKGGPTLKLKGKIKFGG